MQSPSSLRSRWLRSHRVYPKPVAGAISEVRIRRCARERLISQCLGRYTADDTTIVAWMCHMLETCDGNAWKDMHGSITISGIVAANTGPIFLAKQMGLLISGAKPRLGKVMRLGATQGEYTMLLDTRKAMTRAGQWLEKASESSLHWPATSEEHACTRHVASC